MNNDDDEYLGNNDNNSNTSNNDNNRNHNKIVRPIICILGNFEPLSEKETYPKEIL